MTEKHGDHCVRCKKKRDDTTTETIRAYNKKVHNDILYVYYMCRDCNNARHRVYAKTPHGRKACYRASKKYNQNHPDKIKEWKKNRKKL